MNKHLFFGLLLLLSACAKEGDFDTYALAAENNPVFGVQGSLAQAPFELRAGVDDYFLFSDYRYDSSGIFFFSAKFESAACNQTEASIVACPRSFGVSISDVQNRPATYNFQGLPFLRAGTSLDFWEQSLRPSWKGLSFQIQPSSQQSLIVQSYDSFQGNYYEFSPDVSQTEACLAITEGSCADTLCNTIDLQTSCQNTFQVAQTALTNNATQLQLTATGITDSSQAVAWSIEQLSGGSNNIQATGPQAQVQLGSLGLYEVCLENDSCGQRHCIHISTQNYSCAAAYQYEVTELLAPANRLAQKVRITWVDEQGLRYSSFLGQQPNWSRFQIIETLPYYSSESGTPTLRVKALVDARLYNAFGEYTDLREAEVELAFAYPQ